MSSTNSTIILKQILPFPNKCQGNAYGSSTRHVLLNWIWRKRRRSPLASLLENTRHWENLLPHLLVLLSGFFRLTTCVRSFVTNLILDFRMWNILYQNFKSGVTDLVRWVGRSFSPWDWSGCRRTEGFSLSTWPVKRGEGLKINLYLWVKLGQSVFILIPTYSVAQLEENHPKKRNKAKC